MRPHRLLAVVLGPLLAACSSRPPAQEPPAAPPPDVQTREIDYTAGSTPLKGFVAWDASREGRRPGVLIVHEWWGTNENSRTAARRLAEAGYVGFALDMYGNGKATRHPDSAQAFMNAALKDPAAMNARFAAALAELLKDPHVDSTRIGAIGYCFGGVVVLSQAKAGTDLDAVVTFHGAVPPGKVDSGVVRGQVLMLAGADDPIVPPAAVEQFHQAMSAAGANIQVVSYPGAKHGFTNPFADSVGMAGLAYNAAVDRQSWQAMLGLFREVWP
jgi:dienelactone hydrolase